MDGTAFAAVLFTDLVGSTPLVAWAQALLAQGRPTDRPAARALLEEARAGAQHVNIPAIESRINDWLSQLT